MTQEADAWFAAALACGLIEVNLPKAAQDRQEFTAEVMRRIRKMKKPDRVQKGENAMKPPISRITSVAAVSAVSLAALLLTAPRSAEAAWFSRHRHGWRESKTIVLLPYGATSLSIADGSYSYCEGRYYRRVRDGYVVVPAPLGAVVPVLPERHRTVVINGTTYLEYDGIYYRSGPAGYTVVPIAGAESPAASGIAVAAGQAPATASVPNVVVVNVPNKNGSFTPVSLQLAGNGMYIGPQGEIYPNLPTASQLRAMYGR